MGCMSSGCTELRHAVSDPDSDTIFLSNYEGALQKKFANWAKHYKIPMNAISALLTILCNDHPSLPKDACTLLATPVKTDIKKMLQVVNIITLE